MLKFSMAFANLPSASAALPRYINTSLSYWAYKSPTPAKRSRIEEIQAQILADDPNIEKKSLILAAFCRFRHIRSRTLACKDRFLCPKLQETQHLHYHLPACTGLPSA